MARPKPRYLDPLQLIEFTRFYADEVVAASTPLPTTTPASVGISASTVILGWTYG